LRPLRWLAVILSLCVALGFVYAGQPTRAQSPSAQTTLTAAGATFPAPLYEKWFASLEEKHQDIRVSYDAVGSQSGIERFRNGQVDFAGVDMPLSDEMLA
jgi:phosphate transport system substrate-binding protein